VETTVKIWTISDLHLEVEALAEPLEIQDADVCVLAGDLIRPMAEGVHWLAQHIAPWMPVVYVPGNHEYYRSSIREGNEDGLAAARKLGVHLLIDDLVVIEGVRFIGSTLWTDYEVMGNKPLAMLHARDAMTDTKAIALQNKPWQRFLPEDALRIHYNSRAFLKSAMRIPFDGPTVVVTHHCPHPLSIAEKWSRDLLTSAFASDLTDVIDAGQPELWVHGHTHDSFDYEIGNTRVVCNPRGYGNENKGFDPAKVVEVTKRPRVDYAEQQYEQDHA
jgi:Icc-related predicted phosphoesterase